MLFSSSAFAAKPTPEVSDEAKAAIADDFPHAHNVVWKDGADPADYTAYFTEHHERTIATVDRDGDLLSVLKYRSASDLPASMQSLLDRRFAGKAISGVTEFDQYEPGGGDDAVDVTFQVTLEDSAHYYQVRLHNGDIEHVDVMIKG